MEVRSDGTPVFHLLLNITAVDLCYRFAPRRLLETPWSSSSRESMTPSVPSVISDSRARFSWWMDDNRLRIRLLVGGSSWKALGLPRKERGRDSLYVETIRGIRFYIKTTATVDRNTCRPHNMGVHDNLTTIGFC